MKYNRLRKQSKDEKEFIDNKNMIIESKNFDKNSSDKESLKLAKCQ